MSRILRTLALWGAISTAYGQNANLSGFITDPTDAAVPKAVIEVINVDTGMKYSNSSGETGVYSFGSLKPGNYNIKVAAPGFEVAEVKHLKLDVAQDATLNVKLKVGESRETVTVNATAELMQATDATVSTVIGRDFVDNMPLNGRSFNTLVELSPGTVVTATSEQSRGQYAINGQRADSNYYTVDGVSANIGIGSSKGLGQGGGGSVVGASALGGSNNLVSIDALQEFRIMTSTYAPEYGRTAGGQVAIITRSGTNQYHGTAFEYFRNDKLDANNWFSNRAGLGKAAARQNDFGGVLGGPVRADHTFFFFSYEGLRLSQPATVITDVPSLALRQQAPSDLQPFLNLFPLPTGPAEVDLKTGKLNGLAPATGALSSLSHLDAVSLKIDHMINSRMQVFGRYNYSPSTNDGRATSPALNGALNSIVQFDVPLQTFTAGTVFVVTPTVTNDLRANYSRAEGDRHFVLDNFAGGQPLPDSALFPSGFTSNNALLTFRIISGAGTSVAQGTLSNVINQQYNAVDTLSWVKGSHQLKFGVDYRHITTEGSNNAFQAGISYTDTGFLNNVSGTILSNLGSATVSIGRPGELTFNVFSSFAQDTWRVARRLTLTYGLRWELNPPPTSGMNVSLFALNQASNPSTMALAPAGTPLYRTTYRNFAPRFGIAYQLFQSGKFTTVVRTGFGLFYDTGYGAVSSLMAYQPFVSSSTLANITYPFPASQTFPQFVSTTPISNFQGIDPNLALPRTWQWNFSVQQSLGYNQALTVSYVGAAGRRLYIGEQYLGLSPSFTALTNLGTNDSRSDYEALQLQYDHRIAKGLQVLASYTWGHSIDTASNDTTSVIRTPGFYTTQNRGSSDFDIRHDFTMALNYQIPAPHWGGGVSRAILGGWSVDPLVRARTPLPVDITNSRSVTGTTITSRVNLVQGQQIYINDPTVPGGLRFNPAAFSAATGFIQGTLGRNVVHGFPFSQFDVAIQRNFKVWEKMRLLLRGDFFNVLNHPNFSGPNGVLSTPSSFGVATSMLATGLNSASAGGFNSLYQIGGPRSIQLSLRLTF